MRYLQKVKEFGQSLVAQLKEKLPDGTLVFAGAPAATLLAAANKPSYDLMYMSNQTSTLSVEIDTNALIEGAQLMINALSSPYMLIAGIGLGVSILGAIIMAIRSLKVG